MANYRRLKASSKYPVKDMLKYSQMYANTDTPRSYEAVLPEFRQALVEVTKNPNAEFLFITGNYNGAIVDGVIFVKGLNYSLMNLIQIISKTKKPGESKVGGVSVFLAPEDCSREDCPNWVIELCENSGLV